MRRPRRRTRPRASAGCRARENHGRRGSIRSLPSPARRVCQRGPGARRAYNGAGWNRNPTMFAAARLETESKPALYAGLAEQVRGLLAGERDRIANAANFAALVWHALPDINWCGFYFFDGTELVVGPFQGKPACVRIALGKGVCGTAATMRQTQVVADVDAFPGHIPCDSASRSEVVVPLYDGERLIGVWDVDSPRLARFDEADRAGMERLAGIFVESLRAA